jgi:hypothetical protein
MMLVFSVVTYNACMTYQDIDDVNIQSKFEEIGLLSAPKVAFIPPRKPALPNSVVASLNQ